MAEELTIQQKTAIENRGGKLLVSAAAGSGKTKVLVDRLLSFVTDPISPANINEFLIITYTKAAASELRGKIAAKLNERIAQDPTNKHLQHQIQRLYLAKISTVHSFCADIIREYAYRLDIPADFRVADENECVQLQEIAMEHLLETAYQNAPNDPDFCAFIDTQGLGRDDRQIPQILLQVYSSARCHLKPDEWLDWCVSSACDSASLDPADTVWGAYLMDELRSYLALHINALDKCCALASETAGMEKAVQLLRTTSEQLGVLRASKTWNEIRQNANIDFGRLTFSKKCEDLQLAERIKAVRNACKKGLEKKLRLFADSSEQVMHDFSASTAATRGLVALVRGFSREYDQLKQRRRILDFGDLEHKMLDLLLGKHRDHLTAASSEIESRFREIMVDEYQDSNEIQDAIFTALTQSRQNCFMVGDVKQSIYQFRLADPDIFIEKYNQYLPAETASVGQGRKVLLNHNFRSSYGVISAVNDVFCNCMSEKVGGLEYGDAEKLNEGIAHVSISEPEVELYGIEISESVYEEEAALTANRIAELLDGTHMVRDKDSLRPICLDDIVILLRSPGSVGAEFRFALESRGIPCTTGDSTDLLQTEEIGFIRAFLQIINNPLQDIPLISVMTSRVFCFQADDLAKMRGGSRRSAFYDTVVGDKTDKARDFVEKLDTLRKMSRICSLPQLLDHIFAITDLYRIYSSMPDGEIRRDNIEAFYQLVSNYDSGGQNDLNRFLERLDAMQMRGLITDAGNPGGAVTIMSIHKSKGLEFPVVFLCGLSRNFNQESAREQVLCHKDLGLGLSCIDQRQRVRYPGIAKRAIASRIIADSISEEMRVLYVAMTRAKDRLIMTYAAKNLAKDLEEISLRMDMSDKLLMTSYASCPGEWVLLTALGRTEAGEFKSLAGCSVNSQFKEPQWYIRVVHAQAQTSEKEQTQVNAGTLTEDELQKLHNVLSYQYPFDAVTSIPSKQTATQLKGRLKDLEAAENAVREVGHISFRKPGFAKKQLDGKAFGNAFHAFMQYADYAVCTCESEIVKQIQRLVDENLITQEYARLLDAQKLNAFFSSPLGVKLRGSCELYREMKFSLLVDAGLYYPEATGEQILLQGVVDCFTVEEDGITLIDFKTDAVTEETLENAVNNYSIQVSAYGQALERIYKKPIKNKYLYFYTLDKSVQL